MKKSSWTDADDAELRRIARETKAVGGSLTDVFESFASASGRKPGSVRNHYYSILRESGEIASAYVPFSRSEAERLVHDMLELISSGCSVRGAALLLSHGDASLMLRYQNKYRTLCRSDPELIERIAAEKGIPSTGTAACGGSAKSALSPVRENYDNNAELKLAHERFVKLHSMFIRLFEMYRELAESVMEITNADVGNNIRGRSDTAEQKRI